MRRIHLLHLLRGIGASVLTAPLIAFHLLRQRPTSSIVGGILTVPPLPQEDAIRHRARWFIQMRWVAIVLATLAVVVACRMTELLPREKLFPLTLCLLALALSNIVFQLRVSRTSRPYGLLLIQVIVDLLLLTLLLHFSGGIENPFYLAYLFHAVIVGILLSRRGAVGVMILASMLFLGLVTLEYLQVIGHSYVGLFPHGEDHATHAAHDLLFVAGRAFPFLLVMGFAGYFTILLREQIRRNEAGVAQAGKMALIGELVGRISHEINNPNGIILARTKLLLEKTDLPPMIVSTLETIDKQSLRIAELTRGLLTFSRPTLGERFPLNLNRIVEETLALVEPGLQGAGIQTKCDLWPSLPPIEGNPNEMQQILLNLVKNAMDAMPDGGLLSVETRETPNASVELLITDTGVGIAEAVMPRIFDPFFTTKEEKKGTGLGLSITHGLVLGHQGTIEIQSQEGSGTVVVVRFPRYIPAEDRENGQG